MTLPKLFGTSKSRALRSLWGIEEVGIEFEHVPVHYGEESKAPEYLSVNPNGRVPECGSSSSFLRDTAYTGHSSRERRTGHSYTARRPADGSGRLDGDHPRHHDLRPVGRSRLAGEERDSEVSRGLRSVHHLGPQERYAVSGRGSLGEGDCNGRCMAEVSSSQGNVQR